jgi:von Willebrand factor type A domain-containing protein
MTRCRPPQYVLGARSPLSIGLLVAALACSNKGNGEGGSGSGADGGAQGGASGSGSGGGAGGAGSGADANFFSRSDGSPGGGGAGGTPGVMGAYPCLENMGGSCAGTLYKAKTLPTDIYVMFDQSGSMLTKDPDGGGLSRMDAVRKAVDQFAHAPESAGLGMGIGYFGYHALSCACTSCDPKDYSVPAVTIGNLPDQATPIMSSLNAIMPTGETPTGAAIRGACTYAKGRKATDPTRNIVILLVTDGEPQAPLTSMKGTCNPTLEDAVAAATECSAAGVPTYVLGVGPSLNNLNQIAAAGRTKSAYLVANGGTGDIIKALASIRSDAMIPCQLQIPMPAGADVDFQKVNVVYADASCNVSTYLYVENTGNCNGQTGGWYYDDPKAPKQINLCGPTCEQVKAAGGQLVVSVGCMTKIIP